MNLRLKKRWWIIGPPLCCFSHTTWQRLHKLSALYCCLLSHLFTVFFLLFQSRPVLLFFFLLCLYDSSSLPVFLFVHVSLSMSQSVCVFSQDYILCCSNVFTFPITVQSHVCCFYLFSHPRTSVFLTCNGLLLKQDILTWSLCFNLKKSHILLHDINLYNTFATSGNVLDQVSSCWPETLRW